MKRQRNEYVNREDPINKMFAYFGVLKCIFYGIEVDPSEATIEKNDLAIIPLRNSLIISIISIFSICLGKQKYYIY